MDRRDFLKISAAGAVTAACAPAVKNIDDAKKEDVLSRGPEFMPQNYPGIGLLGFGCMRWPQIDDPNAAPDVPERERKIIDQERVNEMVDYAIAHGVNYFDSAPTYLRGQSETATATALRRHPRESYIIATKLSNFAGPWTLEKGKAMFKHSLEVYDTDHLDYFLLHSISGVEALNKRFVDNGLLDYLLEERKKGRIRNLGFSFHGPKEGFDALLALHDKYHWDFVQIQMNYVDWRHDGAEYLYNELARLDIPVVIMEPLLGGGLANVPAVISDKLKSAAPDASVASWAFRFCGSFPRVLTVLSGMECMEHLQDNLRTYLDLKPLSEAEFALLEDAAALMDQFPLVRCTGCQYCMPCPFGIDIPGIFRFYNKTVNEGTYITSKEQKGYARAKRKYLLAYDKAIPTVRQADHCIACGKCVSKCPQRINIPRTLQRIDGYLEELKQDTL